MTLTTSKGFIGIDQRNTLQSGINVASGMRNFRITADGALEKRPGMTTLFSFTDKIEGIWKGVIAGEEITVVSFGGVLYKILTGKGALDELGNIGEGNCVFFEFNGCLYILNGSGYRKYDGETLTNVDGYIPCVAVSCTPDGAGTAFEQINTLSEYRRQKYSCTGNDTVYRLAESEISSVSWVKLDGEEITNYTVNAKDGKITFSTAPKAGLNNLEVCYRKSGDERMRIIKCRRAMQFGGNSDGRIFLWGNPDMPQYRFHSDLADGVPSAEYFPVNNFTVIGDSEITCIVQQYDRQLIFTKSRAYYSYCELKEDSLGNVYSSFPVFSLNGKKGCLLMTDGCVIDNRPVTLCDDGLNVWESTTVENEKNAICISGPIDFSVREAIEQGIPNGLLTMFDFQSNKEFYFINSSIAYVYNYGIGSWYRYDSFRCDCHFVYGGELYISQGATLYLFTNNGAPDPSSTFMWVGAYTDIGKESGRIDLVGAEADVEINGPVEIEFCFDQYGGFGEVKRKFSFPFGAEGYKRLSMRPHIRRAMPVRVTINVKGTGKCTIHRLTLKSRTRERSNRNGI